MFKNLFLICKKSHEEKHTKRALQEVKMFHIYTSSDQKSLKYD